MRYLLFLLLSILGMAQADLVQRKSFSRLIGKNTIAIAHLWSRQTGGIAFACAIANRTWNEIKDPVHWNQDYNCLTIVIKKMKEFGLVMPSPNNILAVPNEYVRTIAANPSLVRINET